MTIAIISTVWIAFPKLTQETKLIMDSYQQQHPLEASASWRRPGAAE